MWFAFWWWCGLSLYLWWSSKLASYIQAVGVQGLDSGRNWGSIAENDDEDANDADDNNNGTDDYGTDDNDADDNNNGDDNDTDDRFIENIACSRFPRRDS